MMRQLAILLTALVPAAAQQVGQNAPLGTNTVPTFSVNSQLVIETVFAKAGSGFRFASSPPKTSC